MENKVNELSYTNKSSLITILILSGLISMIGLFTCVFNRIIETHKGSSIKLAGGKISIDDGRIEANFLDYIHLNDMWIQILVPLLIVAIFLVYQKWDIRAFLGLDKLNKRNNWIYAFLSVAVMFLAGLLIQSEENDGVSFMHKILDENSFFSLIIIAGIMVPISEEVMFRKILYDLGNMFIKKYAPYIGIILSFIMFVTFHFQYSGGSLIYVAILSALLSYGRYYTGGIVIPILIHCINNMFPIIMIN